jgi:hypothetical protein
MALKIKVQGGKRMPDQMKVAFIIDEIRVKNDGKSIAIMIETIKKGPITAKLNFSGNNIEDNINHLNRILECLKSQCKNFYKDTTIYISGNLGIISFLKIFVEQKPRRIFYEKESLKNVPEGEKFRLHKIAERLNVPVIGVN